jgi:cell division transport system permease protein
MHFHRSNLTLEQDEANRFLPWLIAFMVLLAALSIAGLLILKQISNAFEYNTQDTMTIQIPAAENQKIDEQNVIRSLNSLKKIAGIITLTQISKSEVSRLLRPWLGDVVGFKGLPLPKIIDIKVDRNFDLTATEIEKVLIPIIPGAKVDDHGTWLVSLIDTLQSTELIALFIVTLIILATVGTVIFTTRTGMGIHKQTIEVLHFVGAQDEFIAQQFATRAFVVGLQGGIGGILLAGPILYIFDYILGNFEGGLLSKASVDIIIWMSVGIVPAIVALIAMMTAYSTVIKTLKKML